MNITATLLIGALVHALIGVGVFFAPEEPHKTKKSFAPAAAPRSRCRAGKK